MAGSGVAPLRDGTDVLLRVEHLTVEYPAGRNQRVHAVSDVSFDVARGETLGLVGESGSGKSTTGLAIMQLLRPTAGSIEFDGVDLVAVDRDTVRTTRPRFQMVFQNPLSAMNPRRKVADIIAEPLRVWARDARAEWSQRVDEILESVGLDPAQVAGRRAAEFSGGQAQRISIGRALILRPELVVCDEPVSALDVSVQAQILNLLQDLQEQHHLTSVFISHDLAVVRLVSDRLAVMYLGKLCEIGAAASVYESPTHPYTAALLASVQRIGDAPEHAPLQGEVPSPLDPPSGCRFRTRCPRATERCAVDEPEMLPVGPDHFVACHHPLVLEPDAPVAPAHRGPAAPVEPPAVS